MLTFVYGITQISLGTYPLAQCFLCHMKTSNKQWEMPNDIFLNV